MTKRAPSPRARAAAGPLLHRVQAVLLIQFPREGTAAAGQPGRRVRMLAKTHIRVSARSQHIQFPARGVAALVVWSRTEAMTLGPAAVVVPGRDEQGCGRSYTIETLAYGLAGPRQYGSQTYKRPWTVTGALQAVRFRSACAEKALTVAHPTIPAQQYRRALWAGIGAATSLEPTGRPRLCGLVGAGRSFRGCE